LAGLLKAAQIDTVNLNAQSPAIGKLIRELALRTQTGVSIVAIERAGATLVNPGPDEELQPDDQVLLLGQREQLDAARRQLLGQQP
jgi:K+/H+ antiporter YhaU regulatory subunit KhtT